MSRIKYSFTGNGNIVLIYTMQHAGCNNNYGIYSCKQLGIQVWVVITDTLIDFTYAE